jgi:predicted nucleic acid-binding protein
MRAEERPDGAAETARAIEFCDTNVLVYVYDTSAGEKCAQAQRLVERLWDSERGALSIQVLQELYVTLTRKVTLRLAPAAARSIVDDLCRWTVIEPGRQDLLAAIDASERWGISFWDAMLVTAAHRAGAAVLWSEDLSDGQAYNGVVVRNPFRAGTP